MKPGQTGRRQETTAENDKYMITKEQKEQAAGLLFTEKCSCVIRNGDTVRIFRQRGVADLYRLLHEEPHLLQGAFIADKVVGKGAAALMVLGGVAGLFADVVSRPALELLAGAGIAVEYTVAVPNIVNRAGTGICPVEQLCERAETAAECLPLIDGFMRKIKQQHG